MGAVQFAWPKQDPDWLIGMDWAMLSFPLITAWLAYTQIRGHRENSVYPAMQWRYCVVLALPPISALFAWLTLFFAHLERFFEAMTLIYDTFAIVAFFHILLDYCGGAAQMTKTLQSRNANLEILPFPIVCFRTSNHEAQMGRWKMWVNQIWFQPFWALLYAVAVEVDRAMNGNHWMHQDKPYLSGTIHTIMFLHVTMAMLVCLAMYLDCGDKEFVGLNYEVKFASIKLIVFLNILSKTVIAWTCPEEGPKTVYGFTAKEFSTRVLARVRLVQMMIFGIAFVFVFGYDDPSLRTAVQPSNEGADDEVKDKLMAPIEGEEEKTE